MSIDCLRLVRGMTFLKSEGLKLIDDFKHEFKLVSSLQLKGIAVVYGRQIRRISEQADDAADD